MSPSTQSADRVKRATPAALNEKIQEETWDRLASYANKSYEEVSRRIRELDKEWDIERYLGVNMSSLAIAGLAAAEITKNRKWNLLSGVVLAFFFQHSVQGWCPPLPILRLFRIRTRKEIEEERYALKVLRGDFDDQIEVKRYDLQKLRQSMVKK